MPKKFDANLVVRGWVPVEKGRIFSYASTLVLERCVEAIKPVHGKVLDVGCGAGELTKAIKRERGDLEIYGIDILEEAIQKAEVNPEGINFQVASADNLPFKDAAFDTVLLFEVLEHLEAPQDALREVKRVLKKGGIFHFTVPLEASLFTIHGWIKKFFGINLMEKHAGHIQQFTLGDIKRFMTDNDLRIISLSYNGHLIRQLADVFYIPYLNLTNQKLCAITEVKDKSRGVKRKLLSAFLLGANFIFTLESQILGKFPGLDAQITARKDG